MIIPNLLRMLPVSFVLEPSGMQKFAFALLTNKFLNNSTPEIAARQPSGQA
jgi:hypothetical protein